MGLLCGTGSSRGASVLTVADRLLSRQPRTLVGQAGTKPSSAPKKTEAGEHERLVFMNHFRSCFTLSSPLLDRVMCSLTAAFNLFFQGYLCHHRRTERPSGANRTSALSLSESCSDEGVCQLQEISPAATRPACYPSARCQTCEFGPMSVAGLLGKTHQVLVGWT